MKLGQAVRILLHLNLEQRIMAPWLIGARKLFRGGAQINEY